MKTINFDFSSLTGMGSMWNMFSKAFNFPDEVDRWMDDYELLFSWDAFWDYFASSMPTEETEESIHLIIKNVSSLKEMPVTIPQTKSHYEILLGILHDVTDPKWMKKPAKFTYELIEDGKNKS